MKTMEDKDVVRFRELARSNPGVTYAKYASEARVTEVTMKRALTGKTYKHLNEEYPPIVRRGPKSRASVGDVLKLLHQGMSRKKIAKTLRMSSNRVSLICRDKLIADQNIVAENKNNVREMFLTGDYTNAEIGRRVGIHRNVVMKWCRDLRDIRRNTPKIKRPRAKTKPLSEHPYSDYYVYMSGSVKYRRAKLVHKDTGESFTMSAQRYLMSVHLKRLLRDDEVVLSKNNNSLNIEDLILTTSCDIRQQYLQKNKKNCSVCGGEFDPKNKSQTMCSNDCRISVAKNRLLLLSAGSKSVECICSICETPFFGTSKDDDMCYSEECIAILNEYGG